MIVVAPTAWLAPTAPANCNVPVPTLMLRVCALLMLLSVLLKLMLSLLVVKLAAPPKLTAPLKVCISLVVIPRVPAIATVLAALNRPPVMLVLLIG